MVAGYPSTSKAGTAQVNPGEGFCVNEVEAYELSRERAGVLTSGGRGPDDQGAERRYVRLPGTRPALPEEGVPGDQRVPSRSGGCDGGGAGYVSEGLHGAPDLGAPDLLFGLAVPDRHQREHR